MVRRIDEEVRGLKPGTTAHLFQLLKKQSNGNVSKLFPSIDNHCQESSFDALWLSLDHELLELLLRVRETVASTPNQ